MSTPSELRAVQGHVAAEPPDQIDGPREINLLGLAWRSRWLILLATIIGGTAAWAMLQRVTPRYTSTSRIYVEQNLPQILGVEVQLGKSASYLYTQAELLKSTSVLAAAADAPENASLKTLREVDNRVGFLKKRLQVNVGNTDDIINVSLELPEAEEAAQLVNAVVDAYITQYAEKRRTDTVEVLNILRNEKTRRDAELDERRKALEEFRKQNAALTVKVDDQNATTRRFAALAEELGKSEVGLLEAKARYDRLKRMFDDPDQRPFLLEAAESERQRSTRDADLENQVHQIEMQLTSERAKWGEGHPRVRLLRESLTDLRMKLDKHQLAIIEAYVDAARQQYELLDQKTSELRRSHDEQFQLATQVSTQSLELASLEEALRRTETLSDILDERIKEVNLAEDVGAMNVSIMEVAVPATMPSYPQRSRFLAAGLLVGGLAGFGIAWLRDFFDHRFRSVDEIASTLQLPVLGALLEIPGKQKRIQAGRLVELTPRAVAAEAFRTLRTALHFSLAGPDARIIVVTSPSPGDGKSMVASNLAIAMAQADQKVLLIDADMRKPTQHETFGVEPKLGLASVLTERRTVDDCIVKQVSPSLDLLPCGPSPSNPVELLNNGFFAELLQDLAQRYDRVVVDTPPVMPVADARIIAALGDATLLILRAERSTRRVSQAARDELWKVRALRVGVAVNSVPRKQSGYGYGYGYGYGAYGYSGDGYGEVAPSAPRSNGAARVPSRQPVAIGANDTK